MPRIIKSSVGWFQQKRGLSLLLLSLAVFGFTIVAPRSRAQDAKDHSSNANTLTIWHGSNQQPQFLLVELFQEGKRLRTRQLNSASDQSVTWRDLVAGEYEVHCSAVGYAKSVFRILVSEGDVNVLHVKIQMDNSSIVGGGPTIHEIVEELSQLRKATSDLQARVKQLETEVAELGNVSQDN